MPFDATETRRVLHASADQELSFAYRMADQLHKMIRKGNGFAFDVLDADLYVQSCRYLQSAKMPDFSGEYTQPCYAASTLS
jgi:hypothetical protein